MAAGGVLTVFQRFLDAVSALEVSWFTLFVAVTAGHIIYYSLFVVHKPKVGGVDHRHNLSGVACEPSSHRKDRVPSCTSRLGEGSATPAYTNLAWVN